MKCTLHLAAAMLVITGIAPFSAPAQPGTSQPPSLDFLSKPTLVECGPGGAEPCFRLTFGFVDQSGKPVNVQLPPANQLASHIEVQVDGEAVKPFYAAATGSTQLARKPQTTLLLFDISGSMLRTDLAGQSRFNAAKGAAAEFLKNLAENTDQVAVVPFASRDVEKTIAAAHFVNTRAEAVAQLNALPAPEPHNNTALYSAVRASVQILAQHQQPGGERPRLILLTDGSNDVQPQSGDDAGLLTGPSGLATASAAVQQSGVDVLPIGLGNRQSIDEAAMARLGTQPPLITFDLDALHRAFQLQQSPQDAGVTVMLQPPAGLASRTLLAGRVVHFRAKITLPDGTVLVEDRQALWVAPPVATPTFEGEATDAEQRAFLANARLDHGSILIFLRPFIVFVSLAALLAFLWFVLPRFIWPERYDHRSARPVRPEYWPGVEPLSRRDNQPPRKQAPPGFETVGRGARAAARTPGEHTIVRPITAIDATKTRLS
jgi:Mg-chelatase subunit ChlD